MNWAKIIGTLVEPFDHLPVFIDMFPVYIGLLAASHSPSPLEVSQADFGLKCLKSLSSNSGSENICLSPYSLQAAGTLLRLGASGATDNELGQIFEHGKESAAQMAEHQGSVGIQSKALIASGGLLVANGLWSDSPLKPDYVKLAANKFDAAAVRTKFPEPGLSQVNSWVRKNTNNRIPEIFKRLDPETEFVVANAVWFKDNWLKSFDTKRTQLAPFRLPSGESIKVPAMDSRIEFQSAELDGMRICAIPMKNSVFLIGLPQGDVNAAVSSSAWHDALLGKVTLSPVTGSVRLPKFELESEVDLLKVMTDLGMRIANGPKADFSRMTTKKVYVSQARHRTFFKIDEVGAEAAATTAISNTRGSSPNRVIVDRPFLFAIKSDNTILFTGIMNDPRNR